MSERIESFRDLTVYKRAFELQGEVFEHKKLLQMCKEIGRMLGKMMDEPETWCARFTNK